MAVLSRFLQIFTVLGMYNFWKSLKEKETTNQRGYLLRKLALNSFGSGWKVIKQKHEFEDLKVTFWDTNIHSLFTSVHILLLTIEIESKMSCKKSAIFFLNRAHHVPYTCHYNLPLIWNRSWLSTADFRHRFSCLVHKLSVILTALDYKPRWKMG